MSSRKMFLYEHNANCDELVMQQKKRKRSQNIWELAIVLYSNVHILYKLAVSLHSRKYSLNWCSFVHSSNMYTNNRRKTHTWYARAGRPLQLNRPESMHKHWETHRSGRTINKTIQHRRVASFPSSCLPHMFFYRKIFLFSASCVQSVCQDL